MNFRFWFVRANSNKLNTMKVEECAMWSVDRLTFDISHCSKTNKSRVHRSLDDNFKVRNPFKARKIKIYF